MVTQQAKLVQSSLRVKSCPARPVKAHVKSSPTLRFAKFKNYGRAMPRLEVDPDET